MSNISKTDVLVKIEQALELKQGLLTESMCAEEVENWDSLGHLNILVALDKLFDGKVGNITEIAGADSIPKILHILKQHALM